MATTEAAPAGGSMVGAAPAGGSTVGSVISCHSVEDWKKQFDLGASSKKLVVVDFTASWCGPCRFIAPVVADLAKKLHDVIFLKVDVDELKDVSEEMGVEAMPTFLFLKEGKVVDKLVGAKKEELQKLIDKHKDSTAAL